MEVIAPNTDYNFRSSMQGSSILLQQCCCMTFYGPSLPQVFVYHAPSFGIFRTSSLHACDVRSMWWTQLPLERGTQGVVHAHHQQNCSTYDTSEHAQWEPMAVAQLPVVRPCSFATQDTPGRFLLCSSLYLGQFI